MQLTTQQQVDNWNLVARLFHSDKDVYMFGGLDGNTMLPYKALNNNYEIPDFMKFDVNRVHDVIVRMTNKFLFNQSYLDVFNSVFGDAQFQRKDTGAARDWVIAELVKRQEWPPTTETVSQILVDAWNQLPDNATFRETKAETDTRNEQINAMTQGGTTGFVVQIANKKVQYTKEGKVFDAMHGQAQGFSLGLKGPWSRGADSRGFDQLSNEEVNDLFNAWKASNDLRNLPIEELRKLVKSNGATDVFGKNVRVPTVVAPDAQDRLCHPTTGEAFTQKSLIRFINAAPYNGRDLITRNGRIVPRLRDLFERTVRGEL